MLDRLALTPERIGGMAKGILEVAALPDPVGAVLNRVERPNGLVIEKTAVPMGVIAIIYESRPNVTSDAAALALKSGNACVLRCGKEAWRSASAIVTALRRGLREAGLPGGRCPLVEDTTHASANELMTAVGYVDLLIPRGGRGADPGLRGKRHRPLHPRPAPASATSMWTTAPTRPWRWTSWRTPRASRPSVCNAEEVCLVHRDIAAEFLPKLRQRLVDGPGGQRAARRWSCGWTSVPPPSSRRHARRASRILTPSSLDYILAVKVVDSVEEAIAPHRRPLHRPQRGHPDHRTTPHAASVHRRGGLSAAVYCQLPPPALPTAASSAWAARWASPPRSSTPGAPWGWPSCAATSTSSTGSGQIR